ncbi:MAG: sugar phosphate isomerase/epimerase [Methanocorpusculum sp.]|nr:sugar phosphate isomerase/epimerase [Methanocorpusculum sp.]MDD4132588.1 sugar phosphate isomerase/epimerase [Methanocorpusculum sp.]
MKIYFASSSKVWDDPSWVSEIPEAGFDGWEISADGNYRLDKADTFSMVRHEIDEYSLNVSVHAPFSDLNPASINMPIWEETVKQFTVCIEQASLLTDTVVLHPGYLSPVSRFDPAPAWNNHKQACIRLGETAEKSGVTACLENMPNLEDFFCRDPYEQDGFVDGVPGMGLTLDIGHANTTGNLEDFCKIILPKAYHLHIHDNHGKYDEHLPLGKGSIDWNKIMPKIVKEYKGKIIVVEGRNPEEGKKSLEFLRKWF